MSETAAVAQLCTGYLSAVNMSSHFVPRQILCVATARINFLMHVAQLSTQALSRQAAWLLLYFE